MERGVVTSPPPSGPMQIPKQPEDEDEVNRDE